MLHILEIRGEPIFSGYPLFYYGQEEGEQV